MLDDRVAAARKPSLGHRARLPVKLPINRRRCERAESFEFRLMADSAACLHAVWLSIGADL